MFQIRKSDDRGDANHGWLKSKHTFSFADYHNPKAMGFRSLRVINEDRIDGGTGFAKHPHKDMEIISYVVEGELRHEDTMGNRTLIKPGEVQKLSAGTGMMHSEYNNLPAKPTHFFQIWVLPKEPGGLPGYGQKSFEQDLKNKKLTLVISEDGRDGSVSIKQDADLHIAKLRANDRLEFVVRPGRGVWLQIVAGCVELNGKKLITGDAASTDEEGSLRMSALETSEVLIFDLA